VQLPGELVEYIDQLVSDGRATSRAGVISQALQRERRREIAARDAAILAVAWTEDGEPVARLVPLRARRAHWSTKTSILERLQPAQADPGLREDLRKLYDDDRS